MVDRFQPRVQSVQSEGLGLASANESVHTATVNTCHQPMLSRNGKAVVKASHNAAVSPVIQCGISHSTVVLCI